MIRFLVVISVLLLSQSCSKGFGNKLTAKNLNIYFDSTEDEATANSLGKFWMEKDLVGERQQNIKLTKENDYYYVQLIISPEFKDSELKFNERKLLLNLQTEMDTTVFKNDKGCQILICDSEFKALYNIND